MCTHDSLEKSLMPGKIEGKRKRGHQSIRWLDGITDAKNMNLGKLREMVRDREARHAAVHGVTKSQTWLGNWATTTTCSQSVPQFLHTKGEMKSRELKMRRQQTGLMNGSQQRPSPGPLRVRGKFIVLYLNCIGPNNTGEEIEREAEIESRTQCSPLLGDLTQRPTQTPPKPYYSLACELPPLTLHFLLLEFLSMGVWNQNVSLAVCKGDFSVFHPFLSLAAFFSVISASPWQTGSLGDGKYWRREILSSLQDHPETVS